MLDGLTLDQMRTLVAVAETGSFRAAAAKLSRVQSAVSHAIGKLETELGVVLFDRSAHRLTLTSEGISLLADARAILLKVDTLRAKANGLGDGVEVSLTVGLDPQVPLPFAANALRDVQEQFPSVAMRVVTASLGEAVHALQERRCTMSISGIDLPDARIEREALLILTRVAVVARDHPLASRASEASLISGPELADHLQIVAEDPSPLTAGRDYDVLSPGTWRVSDNAIKHALILAGLGWGNLPRWLVERDLAEGRLVRVPTTDFGPAGQITARAWLMRRADEALGPAARALREALIKYAGLQSAEEIAAIG